MAGKLDDLRAAKARRQKKIAAIGGILLVALLVFQVPRTMKMLRSSDSDQSTSSAVEVAPSAPAGATPIPPAAPAVLLDTDPEPQPALGQLVAFSLFSSKDPFVQQVSSGSPSGGGGAAAGGGGSGVPAKASKPTFSPTTQAPPAKPTSAVISVNGAEETVQVAADFPTGDPIFRLVSLTRTEARIGIAGGSLSSGDPTVALRKGKTLTLMNTADGTRYELRLLAVP